VTVLGAVDVVVGALLLGVTVLVIVLVLVTGGGTTTVVVTVLTLVVVDEVVDDVVDVADAAAMTPHATRFPASSVAPSPRLPGSAVITRDVPELFLRSAAVNPLVVVTSFADPSGRTCRAVSWPLAGNPVWPDA